jgi:hypothetical protein
LRLFETVFLMLLGIAACGVAADEMLQSHVFGDPIAWAIVGWAGGLGLALLVGAYFSI